MYLLGSAIKGFVCSEGHLKTKKCSTHNFLNIGIFLKLKNK